MTVRRIKALELAEMLRKGQTHLVAQAVLCDGPMALQLAVVLTPQELTLLRAAVENLLNDALRPAS